MMPSVPQLLIVAAICIVIFGANRLVTISKDAGGMVKGMREVAEELRKS